MLPERLPLDHPIQTFPGSPAIEEQIRSLINREFIAQTSYFLELKNWLEQITLDRLCGRIIGPDRSGKSRAAQHWVDVISGRRGDLLPVPLRIHIIECRPSCDARTLCNLILSSLGRGVKGGKPKDCMLRAWDALKLFKVDILLVDNARYLTENALSTLITLYRHRDYRIPIVLIGSTALDAQLKRVGRFDYFKPFYRFENLSDVGFAGAIKSFEREFLKLPEPVEVIDADAASDLYNVTKGNIEDFTELLIQVIRRSSTTDTLYFDKEILVQVLGSYGDAYPNEEP